MAHFDAEPTQLSLILAGVAKGLDEMGLVENGVTILMVTQNRDGSYKMHSASKLDTWTTLRVLESVTAEARDTYIHEQIAVDPS